MVARGTFPQCRLDPSVIILLFQVKGQIAKPLLICSLVTSPDSPLTTSQYLPLRLPVPLSSCPPCPRLESPPKDDLPLLSKGQGRGADLSGGVALAVPWILGDGLPPAHAAWGPPLSLQHLQVFLVLRAGSPLL